MQMPSVTEYLIGCFLSSLKEHIKIPLRSHCPRTLVQAYSLARNYDTAPQKRSTFDSFRSNSRPPYPPKLNQNSTKKDNTNEKQTTSSKWEKGKYYKCLEPWVPGHSITCKLKNQLHLIAIEDNDEGETESDDNKPVETNVDEDTGPEL
jgi:hypothetical protein